MNATLLKRLALCLLALAASAPPAAHAQSSATSISFQGALTGAGGQPLPNGSYTLGFQFWDHPTGAAASNRVGGAVTVPGVAVSGGVASTAIPVQPDWFNGQTRYLGTTVQGVNAGQELLPRVLVTAVPYAMAAGSVFGSAITTTPVGRVGVGTINPNERLSIAGNLEFQSADGFFQRVAQLKPSVGIDGTTDFGIWTRQAGDNLERMTIRGDGNVGIGTSTPSRRLDVNGDAIVGNYDRNLNSGLTIRGRTTVTGRNSHSEVRFDFASQDAKIQGFRTDEGGTALVFLTDQSSGGPQREVVIYEGRVGINTPNPATTFEVNGATRTTVLQITSARAAKEGFAPVDAAVVLAKVAALPLSTWAYTNSPGVRHVGPVAEDFHAAFALGDSAQHIATVDADGVALAAIQGLHQLVTAQQTALRARESEVHTLQQRLEKLECLVTELAGPRKEEGNELVSFHQSGWGRLVPT